MEHQLAGVARFLIAWLAAFLIVVALFSVFGQQLKAMSPQLRALTLSGVLTVAMNFLVMPTLTRLLSRVLPSGSTSETHSLDDRSSQPLPQDDRDPDQAAAGAAPGRSVADLHLRTDRLEPRALTLGDLDELASMLADADALTYWGPPLSREQSRSWIERNRRRYQLDGFGRCAVILRSTGELVGDCGLARMLIEGQPVVELGWIVRRGHRGKGIATEAAAAWRDYAFDTLGLDRVVSMVSEKNVAFRRVAEKLGMTVDRRAIMDGPHTLCSRCTATRETDHEFAKAKRPRRLRARAAVMRAEPGQALGDAMEGRGCGAA